MSALTRIAYNDHPAVKVERGDTVIISAKPVPGNELRVHDAINRLAKARRRGAARGDRARARLRPRLRRGAADADLARCGRKALMPMHGEFRMLAAHAQLARDAGHAGRLDRDGRERLGRRAEPRAAPASSTGSTRASPSWTGSASATSSDVALRDRRHLSEDGVLIIVATLAARTAPRAAAPELIARGFAEPGPLLDEMRERGRSACSPSSPRRDVTRDQAPAGAPARRRRPADLRPNGAAAR